MKIFSLSLLVFTVFTTFFFFFEMVVSLCRMVYTCTPLALPPKSYILVIKLVIKLHILPYFSTPMLSLHL